LLELKLKMIKKLQSFIENVQKEMAKVTWSTKDELLNSSFIVIVVTALFTIYILFADLIISKLVEFLY
jgi:preprotein translocase SecE subunit